jgi:plastocyanin
MHRPAVGALALALAAACSSGSGTATLSSPSPVLPTTSSPTVPATTPPASPSATKGATPSLSPAARRTASATPSPTRSRTPSPKPSPTPSPTPVPTGKTYAISEVAVDRFSPSTLSLRRGDSVLVTNKDSTDHTFTVGSLGKDSGNMTQGDTYRLTFSTRGTFDFVCTYHESLGMKGTITVSS